MGACVVALWAAPLASAHHYDELLPPEPTCSGGSETGLKISELRNAAACLHEHVRGAAGDRERTKPHDPVPPAEPGRPSGAGRPDAQSPSQTSLSQAKSLRASANAKARDILRCDDFSHDACGRDVFHWQRREGYARGCYGVGENLFYAPPQLASPRDALSAWLHSPAHRGVVLDPSYEEIGIASRLGVLRGHEVRLWVVHLGYRC